MSIDVGTVLGNWRKGHRDFVVGGNEAGLVLGGETRGADAAVWRRADLGPNQGKYFRVPPILAVEIQGKFDEVHELRAKAQWYLAHGVHVVWLLLPEERRALVVRPGGELVVRPGARMPSDPLLPGLEPMLDELFEQVDGR
jgi:Uma2 family endonuclease